MHETTHPVRVTTGFFMFELKICLNFWDTSRQLISFRLTFMKQRSLLVLVTQQKHSVIMISVLTLLHFAVKSYFTGEHRNNGASDETLERLGV